MSMHAHHASHSSLVILCGGCRDFYVRLRQWLITTELDSYRAGRVLECACSAMCPTCWAVQACMTACHWGNRLLRVIYGVTEQHCQGCCSHCHSVMLCMTQSKQSP